jgi:STE24 endopeptidase
MRQPSLHANLVFFGLLAAPLVTVLSLAGNALSRRREYEADAYAAATGGGPEPLIAALKRLSRDSLVNLTPHPLKVVLSYSHPPMLDRIRALRLY